MKTVVPTPRDGIIKTSRPQRVVCFGKGKTIVPVTGKDYVQSQIVFLHVLRNVVKVVKSK